MMKQPRCAFTLVEILVVLAIVMLLAALLFPVFGRVRENGRAATCLSNQKQILLALQLYQDDAAGHFPLREPNGLHNLNRRATWIDCLLIYAKTPALFVCPSDGEIEDKRTSGFVTVVATGEKLPAIPSSYLAGEALLWNHDGRLFRPRALSEVASPSSAIFLTDGAKEVTARAPYWENQTLGGSSASNGLAMTGYVLRDPQYTVDEIPSLEPHAPNPRHNGRAAVGFVDGHVKSMELSQWYFPNSPFLDPARGG